MDVLFGEKTEDWIEITVDSAAEESACPHDWGRQFVLREVEHKMNLVNASGGKPLWGEAGCCENSPDFLKASPQNQRVVSPLPGKMIVVEGGRRRGGATGRCHRCVRCHMCDRCHMCV